MTKYFYILASMFLLLTISSCSKQCIQCQAKDKSGVVINTSNVICEYDLNRNNFEDRYKAEFRNLNASCINK